MELTDLGFDDWFAQRAAPLPIPGCELARVTAVDREGFLVRNATGEIAAQLAGRFRFALQTAGDWPCVGDWVWVQWPRGHGPGLIQAVLPRKSCLRRKAAGKTVEYQTIAANLDVALIVQALPQDLNLARLQRYLVMAQDSDIQPWIILSKTDLIEPEQCRDLLAKLTQDGITAPILPLSNTTGDGWEQLQSQLQSAKTYCLLGSSGVGKTTILNRLLPDEELATNPVSTNGRGVHTTVRRQLLLLDNGGLLIDTPGLRELALLAATEGLDNTFAELEAFATQCRFPDCSHTQEPDCAVQAALENGQLSAECLAGYRKLKKESAYHELSYAQKRRRDRAFGRYAKSVLKQKHKDRDW